MIYKDFFEASNMANLQAKYPDNKADQRYYGGFSFRDETPLHQGTYGENKRVHHDLTGKRYYFQGYVNGKENWIPFDE